ncbi:type II toxin-antitoxin system prevent-host-death family antitoxin [bacterium]|nr:MAG: type II toxin-antitoxin system Phd/YefM family antitoxin [candidate division KSB1 bacterium]MCE7945252.1 type II toxin-antitoxin system Phd/YefM family antitoxin [Chlorobi bacterium CHB1]MCL4708968.1 type II toxin-antitoxin system prevent-host-death family antitoxin [bacterium]MDL1878357.1 type II toxin-antitoxin system Phd/YefM family antitoxin [Cytophagia bacterium CHB2]MBC6949515.1 type II toxin-antitoxin system Phd/YefM family antitoxin [candidate division KSB1 bacterium]
MLEILQKRTISITELESKAGKIVAEARRSGKPYLITQNGKPMALLLDAKSYLDELATEALARQIATGEADIAAGKVEDLEEVLKEVRRARTVSRSRRQARQN